MTTGPSFLGAGWDFPPRFSSGGAQVAVVAGVDDVHRSLQTLLATAQGERPMQESFGCNIDAVMFDEVNASFVHRLTNIIYDAILEHEPRVALNGVDVQPSDDAGRLDIRIEYEIRETNSRFNLVFPFFLNEATALRG